MSLIGIPIGIYGYLFPGNINIMVLELYSLKKYRLLLVVLALIVLFESAYCVLTLFFLNKLKTNIQLNKGIELLSYFLVLIMGMWMLLENRGNRKPSNRSTLYRGIISIILHPQQVPFWFIIGVVIKPLLRSGKSVFTITSFILFNAIGVLIAMCIYMVFGEKMLLYLNLNLSHINKATGLIYILFSVYSLLRF